MLQKVVLVLSFIVILGLVPNRMSAFSIEETGIPNTKKPKPVRTLVLNLLQRSKEAHPKATAIALTATLGPFGAHRIYLGTHYTVPLFYTVTLGGGLGVLPASDLLVLIFTKDITKYYDNSKIFMWDVD